MLPYIHIGPVMLQLPGLALLLGLWLGLEIASRQALRLRLSGETISNLVLLGLLGGVVGARLGYAARYPEAFVKAIFPFFLRLSRVRFVIALPKWSIYWTCATA